MTMSSLMQRQACSTILSHPFFASFVPARTLHLTHNPVMRAAHKTTSAPQADGTSGGDEGEGVRSVPQEPIFSNQGAITPAFHEAFDRAQEDTPSSDLWHRMPAVAGAVIAEDGPSDEKVEDGGAAEVDDHGGDDNEDEDVDDEYSRLERETMAEVDGLMCELQTTKDSIDGQGNFEEQFPALLDKALSSEVRSRPRVLADSDAVLACFQSFASLHHMSCRWIMPGPDAGAAAVGAGDAREPPHQRAQHSSGPGTPEEANPRRPTMALTFVFEGLGLVSTVTSSCSPPSSLSLSPPGRTRWPRSASLCWSTSARSERFGNRRRVCATSTTRRSGR